MTTPTFVTQVTLPIPSLWPGLTTLHARTVLYQCTVPYDGNPLLNSFIVNPDPITRNSRYHLDK